MTECSIGYFIPAVDCSGIHLNVNCKNSLFQLELVVQRYNLRKTTSRLDTVVSKFVFISGAVNLLEKHLGWV